MSPTSAQSASPLPPANSAAGQIVRLLLGLLFIAGVVGYVLLRGDGSGVTIVAIAAAFGAYMAMNIGANDVANNVGPAVGSKVLTLGGALAIAAIFEAAGAIIAGGEVVGTIRSGIIKPDLVPDPQTFVWLMMAALLAAALWLNLASAVGAPISTTHSIVGAVLGAGVAAAGMDVVNWGKMTGIVASWVVSPLLGAGFAAFFLYLIKRTITYQKDMVSAARTYVPVLVALMAWAFATYLLLKGLNRLIPVSFAVAVLVGFFVAVAVLFISRAAVLRRAASLENGKQGINRLFALPLIFAAALLSFAHGSNDVANAIGPLAAIIDVVVGGHGVTESAPIPMWVMVSGALGISVGLALYGPRVIRTVGSEITELDPMRAYCIAMAATLTVIVASQLGLPISTTHVAVGAVFGVGFLREYHKTNWSRIVEEIKAHHPVGDQAAIDAFMTRFSAADIAARGEMLRELKRQSKARLETPEHLAKGERKQLRRAHKQELVKRSLVLRIVAAWVITVPASAFIAAFLFFALRGMMME